MKTKPSIYILLFFAAFGCVISGCSTGPLAPAEYVEYTQDQSNGLHVQITADSFTYDLQYEPAPYYVLKKVNPYELEAGELDTIIKEADLLEHFNLRLGHETDSEYLRIGSTDPDEYFQRLRFYSFEVQNHLFLIQDQDTLRCLGVQFERTYNVAPFINLALTFDSKRSDGLGSQQLVYFDPLRNNEAVPFDINHMNKIPELKL
jgi:hypothetical protein